MSEQANQPECGHQAPMPFCAACYVFPWHKHHPAGEPSAPQEPSDLAARVREYLGNGGLFNPELMEHDKVRQLIMDLAARLAQADQALTEARTKLAEAEAKQDEACVYEICGCSGASDGHCMMCCRPLTEHRLIPRGELAEIERRLKFYDDERNKAEAAITEARTRREQAEQRAKLAEQALANTEAERDTLQREVAVDNQLLADRQRILDACPCPVHGPCVPHVLNRLKEADTIQRERDDLLAQGMSAGVSAPCERTKQRCQGCDGKYPNCACCKGSGWYEPPIRKAKPRSDMLAKIETLAEKWTAKQDADEYPPDWYADWDEAVEALRALLKGHP